MSDNNQSEHDEQIVEKTTTMSDSSKEETRVTQVRRVSPPNRNKAAVVAIVAVVAIAGVAIVAWLLWPSQAGKPVPAPRSISVEGPANEGTRSSAQTLTLTADQL